MRAEKYKQHSQKGKAKRAVLVSVTLVFLIIIIFFLSA